jgi:drug/metabolite transporter (DMT)-like permease
MIFLFLCILSSTMILVVFKLLERFNINVVTAIVINYFTASVLGFLAGNRVDFAPLSAPWMIMAMVIGFFFVFMFYVIAYSTRIAGITVTSLTTKLSVAIPVLFSIIVFNESVTFLKVSGMILALLAIVMIVYRPHDSKAGVVTMIFLPALLFFGAGFIDSMIKYAQEMYVTPGETLAFSTFTFMVAAVISLAVRITRRYPTRGVSWYKTVAGGMALGLVNFGSLYFIVMALGSGVLDSSVIFGINHIGIVLLSALAGMVFFSERLTILNKGGIVIAIIAITILFFA